MPMQVYQELPADVETLHPLKDGSAALTFVDDDADSTTPYRQIMEFISKIGQVILRARVGLRDDSAMKMRERRTIDAKVVAAMARAVPSALSIAPPKASYMDVLALMERTDFWRTCMPVNFDIFEADRKILLERWVVSYEPSDRISTNSPTTPTPHSHRRPDPTDLILLIQSLYSHIRLMPLHAALSDGKLEKSELGYCITTADGFPLSPVGSDDEDDPGGHDHGTMDRALGPYGQRGGDYFAIAAKDGAVSFEEDARLKVYKFRTASTWGRGKLHLSVVYDSSVAGLVPRNPSLTPSPIKTVASERPEFRQPPCPRSAPATSRRTSSLGSPFPSPTMQKKVLNFAQSKLVAPKSATIVDKHSQALLFERLEVTGVNPDRITANEHRLPPTPAPFHHSISAPIVSHDRTATSSRKPSLHIQIPPNVTSHTLSPYTPSQPLRPLTHHASLSSIRRPSVSHNLDSLHGPLVGSYEESILSGRMSTLPSHPIQHYAEIGVLAIGKCKPHLRCPEHLVVGFEAFWYEWDGEGGTPYVGCVDLANGVGKEKGERNGHGLFAGEVGGMRKKKMKETGYRIPPKGQLQIMIKNAHRTAMKVFLLPYDFRDMPTGHKTFLRQKSYSVPKTQSATIPTGDSQRHLRYAIHIPVVKTEKGRLYVGPALRVVFSSRAPDGDEKVIVRSETLEGEHRYMKVAAAADVDPNVVIDGNGGLSGLGVSYETGGGVAKPDGDDGGPEEGERLWPHGFR
ncbi:hypothetical protein BC832DRAFT_595321 [Gaertneriomyces semiglobifer]|nr:hypothetical protein BC832DRAFT_595321 [Gaertneriomyces semiglobifer]